MSTLKWFRRLCCLNYCRIFYWNRVWLRWLFNEFSFFFSLNLLSKHGVRLQDSNPTLQIVFTLTMLSTSFTLEKISTSVQLTTYPFFHNTQTAYIFMAKRKLIKYINTITIFLELIRLVFHALWYKNASGLCSLFHTTNFFFTPINEEIQT